MLFVILLSITVSSAFGCQPTPGGNGGALGPYELSTSPTFNFLYSPPVGWTYNAEPVQGQSRDPTQVLQLVRATVKDHFLKALKDETPFITPNIEFNSNFTDPIDIKIIEDRATALQSDEGRVELGCVSTICLNTTVDTCAEAPLIQSNALYVQNAPLLTGQQWKNVANRLYSQLLVNDRVYFRAPITVTK